MLNNTGVEPSGDGYDKSVGAGDDDRYVAVFCTHPRAHQKGTNRVYRPRREQQEEETRY